MLTLSAFYLACVLFVGVGAAVAQSVDVSSTTRLNSVMAFMRARDPKAVPDLAARFAVEPVASIRAWIVRAVSRLDAKGGLALLESGLQDQNPEVRIAAAEALGKLGGAEAAADLAATLGTEISPGVRASIAFWLGTFKDAVSAAALGQVLASDPDSNVRVQAARSLKQQGTRAARQALKAVKDDRDERVRGIADE